MEEIIIRKATLEDVDKMYAVMQEAYDSLTDKSMYVLDDYEFVKNVVAGAGVGVVGELNQDIISVFLVSFPGENEDNLGIDIGILQEDLHRVANMESAAVKPIARGQHLQYRMMEYAESIIPPEYDIFLATIDPDNHSSYNTGVKMGYREVARKKKYGGLIRAIVRKDR